MTRRLGRMGLGLLLVAALCGRVGAAFQRTTPTPVPAPTPDYGGRQLGGSQQRQSPFDDQMMREMEEKRGKALSNERRRLMVRDADQLVQVAAEFQAKVTQEGTVAAGREDEAKRAELIEKLAKSVKERMRGNR